MLTLLSIPLALYVALLVYVFAFQAGLVFYPQVPGRALTSSPAQIGLPFESFRIRTADGEDVHAWHVPAAAPGAMTVLFCHGNAGNISHRLEWLKILHELGFAVLLFDYRGYGESTGSVSERGTYEDARAAWRYLTEVRGAPASQVIVFGESLGAAVASHLAKEVKPAALILSSAFTSVPDLGARFYWYLPVRLLARIHYPTAEHLAQVRAPVVIMHSRDDEIVPFSHGEALFRRANEPKQFLEMEGDHNAGFLMSEDRVRTALKRFAIP